MFLHGLGTAPDLVRAHMWENTSALIGNKQAIKYRASISGRLNLEELDAAQKMAKDCLATKFTGCE